jgi:hypothetical protein
MRKEVYDTLDCYHVCTETSQHCLKMGGKHAEPEHLNLMMDCAKICLTTADFLMRNSRNSSALGDLCARICEACADDCQKLDGEEMKRCAEVCRTCATTCRAMAK